MEPVIQTQMLGRAPVPRRLPSKFPALSQEPFSTEPFFKSPFHHWLYHQARGSLCFSERKQNPVNPSDT